MTKFIDFNNLAAGTVVDNEFSSQGVTISATGGSNQAMIFNTAQPTGEDPDLGTTNLNGALIISEDGNRNDPDDNQGGGTFTFTFDDTASVNRLTFLDIEEGATVRFFGENGKLISSVNVQATSDNGQIIQDFDVDGVARMEVTLNGSGAIDNLVFDDTGLDGVVEGSNDDDVIDAGFDGDVDGDRIDANDQILPGEGRDDDIVDALGGDDRILSGNGDDEVFAGSGDDTVDGGAGDDVIFGDSNYAGPGAGTTVRESFEWDLAGSNNGQNIGGFTQDTGNVNVTFSVQQSASAETEFASNNQNIANIDADGAPVDDNSSLSSELSGNGASADYRVDFSAPVENVSFRVNDIDVSSVVRIKAFDAAGNPIVVNLEGGSNLTLTDTDTVTGNDTADGNGGNLPDTAPEFSVLVSIAGPVARIEIEHDQVGNGNSGVNITDVYFDAVVVDDGAAGDDSLSGGDGDDTIFGEDGNDTLRGGDGDDSLVGGANNDSLVGGNGDDVLDGGFGRDTLFGGNGNDTAFGGNGADEIWVGGGNDSVDGGANDDWIHGQSGNDTLNGDGGDDMIFGEDGNDVLAGGSGNDTLDGGANADTIFGGAGDVVDGGAGGFSNNPAQNTDLDVLDLTGQGAFFLDNVTPDSNGNGIDGTVVFVDANGNPTGETIAFTEIEEVIGDVFNRGPDAVNDTAEVDEDGSVDINVLGNDVDPDGDALTVIDASSPDGDVTINPDGTITFTPNENFNGDTTITYTVTDPDGAEDTATVSVTVNAVNDDPVAVDDVASTDEDTAVIVDLIGNDTDVDGDDLTIGTVSVPADQGEVVDNGDGTVTFTPAPDFNGEATITYTVIDGQGGEDEGTATVTVNAVNDGPLATDNAFTVDEDNGPGGLEGNVLADDSDPEGDTIRVIEVSNGTDSDSVADPFGGLGQQMTVAGDNGGLITIANGGNIEFDANGDFEGLAVGESTTTSVTYTISDNNGGTDTATVTFTVEGVNDAPVAVDDTASTDEDTAVIVDLIGNDTDVDGDPLTIGAVSVPAEQGEVVDNGDGTVTFTPAANFNGPATITYTVIDGNGGEDEGEATVNVGAVNDGPVANDDAASTDEDTPVTIDAIGNDTDEDGDDLTITAASVPGDQGTVEIVNNELLFTPAENFNGEATISYSITDGNGGTDTAEVTVTVNAVNDAPVAVDDAATTDEDTAVIVDLIGNDTDVDGDPLTIGAVSVPAEQGEVVDNGDGTVTFTPAPDFNGEATITYTVIDGNGGEDEGQAIVTVGAVNDGPVANDDTAEVDEDGSVDIPVLGNDTDLDGDDLRVIEASSPDGEVTINPDGTITFAPAENFNGDTTITYTITDDNGGTDTATVNVTVNPVNDAPVAMDDADTTPFDTPVTIDVLGNDTDVDGDDLRVIAATSPNGDVEINPDGTLTFTPTPGFEGEAIIDYTITDDNGGQDSAQVTVLVEDQPLDGIVSGTEAGELIDEDFLGDPEGDRVDNNDEILPGEGPNDDIIQAGGGDDTIIAGEGNDDVFAGTGDDQVHGGSGDDILRGEEGADTINGGAGDDTIEGGDDDDVINGGDGADSVLGGTGNDVIDTSDDLFAPDLGFPNDDGTPAPGFPFGFAADDDPEDDRDFVDGGEGDDTISTGDDADTIIGGSGDDVIDGGIDADEITGDDGADRIVGGEGSDVIDGGEGDDTIFAGNDPDLGLDQLNIEDDGSNPLFPADPVQNNGMDTVFGGEGNDIIFGADDDDQLFGEEGNDTIDGEVDDDFIDGGIGDDSLLGGQGNDTILGGDGDDFIDGGGQADTVDGGDGSDTIIGGNGADVLNGGAGDDFIDGGTGDDTLNGDDGDDFITGATGDDVIDGGAGNDTIDGGNGGNDIMSGGDDRDTFINVNAGEVVDGDEGGDDFDTLDLRGAAPGGGSLNIVFDAGNPENGVVNFFDTNGEAAGSLTFSNIENIIPCFTPGTMIATPQGERRVEDLIVGDRVITRDNGIQEIRWVGKRHMSGEELAAAQHLRPVLIRQGALGRGLPERDMLVSPQHRVLMSSDKTELYFDESEVLVAAKHLTDMDGIDVVDASATTYIHVMFDQHEVILSDGAWTESFQPGDQTLASMGAAQRAEILELFPELETEVGIEAYTAARRSLKKHEAKLLTQ